jgi:glycosyltransferase involved in cell wall biosynthesis
VKKNKFFNLIKALKWRHIIKKSNEFDIEFYLNNYKDVKNSKIDPILHYILYGAYENRKPNKDFDTQFYCEYYKDIDKNKINPLIHYILYGKKENRIINENQLKNKKNVLKNRKINYFDYLFNMLNQKSNYFVDYKENNKINTKIKMIAFYLPQFHQIPENDKWWGKGFTEWTNVTKAIPQYVGHYQPHLPGELGFYDLRINEILERQVKLAKNYGIYGFCFHFYWFNGKRLLEKPLESFINNKNIDFPFCINWANENWTRRWDGLDNEILMKQDYSPDDDIEFIKEVSKLFKHKNYIKINNKPLLMIYRPALFPNIKETAKRWRNWCKNNGIGDLYLVLTHSFEKINPKDIGFDAAVEFPPNRFGLKKINEKIEFFNSNFKGDVYSYDELIEKSIKNNTDKYKKFKGICPSWDNEARKPGKGTSLFGANPEKYKKWLKYVCEYTDQNFAENEKLLFVNAWNEWAEGAHLEPDRYYGYAYLQATYDVLKNFQINDNKIVYVSHDAHYHGAQLLSLNIIKILKEYFNLEVCVIVKKGGVLEDDYKKHSDIYFNLSKDENIEKIIKQLSNKGFKKVILNTVVNGDLAEFFKKFNFKVITLVHELPNLIRNYKLENNCKILNKYSDYIIFPSSYVKEKIKELTEIDEKKSIIRPQGLYKNNKFKNNKQLAKKILKDKFNIDSNKFVVLGVGFADKRKGFDLFVQTAKLLEKEKDIVFLWVGKIADDMKKWEKEAKKLNNIILAGLHEDVSYFYAGSDLLLLTSREDPFPSVVLEALDVGLPFVGFKNAGGFKDLAVNNFGKLVDFEDVHQLSKIIMEYKSNKEVLISIKKEAPKFIEYNFNFIHYVFDLLKYLDFNIKKVSVIIPNYNYEKYIKERIVSIIKNNYPIYEIIFLDDGSKDNSVDIAEKILENQIIPYKIIVNKQNSGSVFKQWAKGIKEAKGDYIWIAEADDLCEENFLNEIMKCFDNENVVLAYSQSKQIDEKGRLITDSYLNYTNDIDRNKWKSNYILDGEEEIKKALSIKNTIPNISAVVFKKIDIEPILRDIEQFKIAGDWYFYYWILKKGKICYIRKSLNLHRRHKKSVTKKENNILHFNEILKMQQIIEKNYNLDEQIRQKQIEYRNKVKKYLNIKD